MKSMNIYIESTILNKIDFLFYSEYKDIFEIMYHSGTGSFIQTILNEIMNTDNILISRGVAGSYIVLFFTTLIGD